MNSTRRTGTGMFIISWVVLLALLTWYFGLREDNRHNPNRDLELVGDEIVLEKNAFDQYVFSGEINNIPVTFLIDTGANSVVVGDRIARQAGLTAGQAVPVVTASGYTTAWRTEIDSIEIGPIQLVAIDALINPDMPGDHALLGMTALEYINFRQENNRLILNY